MYGALCAFCSLVLVFGTLLRKDGGSFTVALGQLRDTYGAGDEGCVAVLQLHTHPRGLPNAVLGLVSWLPPCK